MKIAARISTLLFAVVALGLAPSTPLRAAPPTIVDLVGSTWELVWQKSGDATEKTDVPSTERKIKLITATHFVWIAFNQASGKNQSTGGGTYSLDGATYTEVVEFGDESVAALRGEKQIFTLDLKGDRLEQTGRLSTGFKIEEVWQRVR